MMIVCRCGGYGCLVGGLPRSVWILGRRCLQAALACAVFEQPGGSSGVSKGALIWFSGSLGGKTWALLLC
jgi:hypothetical protein